MLLSFLELKITFAVIALPSIGQGKGYADILRFSAPFVVWQNKIVLKLKTKTPVVYVGDRVPVSGWAKMLLEVT